MQRCEQETANFFQRRSYDPRYCFEVFRRAIVERIEQAWECVYTQYRPLLVKWMTGRSAFFDTDEEVGELVNRAFTKMWVSITPERFDDFQNLDQLLTYLRMCGGSVVIDNVRAKKLAASSLDEMDETHDSGQSRPERIVLTAEQRQGFWLWIQARLHGEKEQTVIYASFVLDLRPREIVKHYKHMFNGVREVHRIKQNVYARLRRDPDAGEFLSDLDQFDD